MAKAVDKMLGWLKLAPGDDEYDDDFYDDDYEEEEELARRREERRAEKEQRREEKRAAREESYHSSLEEEPPAQPRKTTFRTSSNKVVPIRTAPNGMGICIVKPKNFGDSQQVCEILLDNQPVIVSLEGMDIMEAQRIMDFISGCIFSISGNMRQVSRYIFVFSPQNIDISGDYIINMAETEGFNIPTLNKGF